MNTTREKSDCCSPKTKLGRIWYLLCHENKTPCGDPCITIPGHVSQKPDPCIYDQFLLMALNQPVTWDNPDVSIELGGVKQYTYNLVVSTVYTLNITIHNSSRTMPADGTTVTVQWIEFGAGGQTLHPIATLTANVPVWPGTAVVTTPWETPAVPGHYCIQIDLFHPNDGNPANNRGQNNTQVYAAQSPVTRPIRIFNRYPNGCPPVKEGGGPILRPHRVFLGWAVLGAVGGLFLRRYAPADWPFLARVGLTVTVGYFLLAALGLLAESIYAWLARAKGAAAAAQKQNEQAARASRISCNLVEIEVDSYVFNDGLGKTFNPDTVFAGKAPIWPAQVVPPSFLFQPGEAYRDVELLVDAPNGPGPSGVFNVNVRQGGVPSGGVTIDITRGP